MLTPYDDQISRSIIWRGRGHREELGFEGVVDKVGTSGQLPPQSSESQSPPCGHRGLWLGCHTTTCPVSHRLPRSGHTGLSVWCEHVRQSPCPPPPSLALWGTALPESTTPSRPVPPVSIVPHCPPPQHALSPQHSLLPDILIEVLTLFIGCLPLDQIVSSKGKDFCVGSCEN